MPSICLHVDAEHRDNLSWCRGAISSTLATNITHLNNVLTGRHFPDYLNILFW